jgi:hypothetical protein
MSFVPAHEHLTGRGRARRWYLPQVLLLIADSRAGCKKMHCLPGAGNLVWNDFEPASVIPGCSDWTTFSFVHQVPYRRERAFLERCSAVWRFHRNAPPDNET